MCWDVLCYAVLLACFRFPEELNGHQCYDNIIYGILAKSGYLLQWAPISARVVAVKQAPRAGASASASNGTGDRAGAGNGRADAPDSTGLSPDTIAELRRACSCALVLPHSEEEGEEAERRLAESSLDSFAWTTLK